jgi:hypothetical protein
MRIEYIRVDPVQLDLYRIEATYRQKLMELKKNTAWLGRHSLPFVCGTP